MAGNFRKRNLWIGNIDFDVTEYEFVKLIRKFGEIEDFYYPIHNHLPCFGKPKGFGFVTYKTEKEARSALKLLDGFLLKMKPLKVHWGASDKCNRKAHDMGKVPEKKPENKAAKIEAIKRKLQTMEENPNIEDEFSLSCQNNIIATRNFDSKYQQNVVKSKILSHKTQR